MPEMTPPTSNQPEAQTQPNSQEVADILSRAFDAVCDVLTLLDENRICWTSGSLEDVALAEIMGSVVSPGRQYARRLSPYLCHLPKPTEARRHQWVPDSDEIPF